MISIAMAAKAEPAKATGHDDARQGAQKHPLVLYTIGHATRSTAELVEMLEEHGVKTLVDVRTVPKSRTNPQHNRELFEEKFAKEHGVGYVWMGKELGGLRKKNKELSPELNGGWRNDSFHKCVCVCVLASSHELCVIVRVYHVKEVDRAEVDPCMCACACG